MRLALLLTSIVSLVAAAGCSATTTHAAAPQTSDASWTPPGQMDLSYEDGRDAPAKHLQSSTSMKPNGKEIQGGQIHAATY